MVWVLLNTAIVERVVKHQLSVAVAVTVITAGVMTSAVPVGAERDEDAEVLIRRVVAQTTRSGVAIKATRELRAGTVSGKHQGWMTVETAMTPDGAFSWNVVEEGGSARTREKVFVALLKTEADATRSGDDVAAALTPANYHFTPLPQSRPGQIAFRLTPRREDSRLVDGVLTTSADGYPIRLEGKLAKSPSFWVKSVTVVKRYGKIAGMALPTSVESLAEIRMFGRSTFTMRYRYSEVGGRSVSHAVASAPLVGPSAEILALHRERSEQ